MRTRYVRVSGIGLRRNLANSALDLNGGKELQADAERQTNPQRDREIRPDVDDRLSDVGRATVTTLWPGDITCPTSALTAVTTPAKSAFSCA